MKGASDMDLYLYLTALVDAATLGEQTCKRHGAPHATDGCGCAVDSARLADVVSDELARLHSLVGS